MKVVAEGVETALQVAFLKEIKCDVYQGYYCAKALSPDDFVKLVEQGKIYNE